MATITPVLWKSKPTKKGELPIYLRLEAGDRRLYVTLRLYVKARHWNASRLEVRKTHPHFEEMNALIGMQVNAATKAVLQLRMKGEEVTPEAIKAALLPPKLARADFCAYGRAYAEQLHRRNQIQTANRYQSIMRKLERFYGGKILFSDINRKFAQDFETYLLEELGNGKSTVANNFRAVKRLVNLAKKDGLIPHDANPFEGISTKEPPGQKRKLSADEIRALRKLELEENTPLWHARNYWLFAMFVGGMRFRDFADLRVASVQGDRLDYRMSKTSTHKSVDLPPIAAEILVHYVADMSDLDARVFPVLRRYDTSTADKFSRAVSSQNALINLHLKQVAAKAGVYPGLSFHQSRHSFANLALADGWSVRKIQAALGHKDIATTERYLRELDAEFTGDEMGKLFRA